MRVRHGLIAGLLLACMPAFAQVDVDAFAKKDEFGDTTISPKGEYFAATVPRGNSTGLVVFRRADNKLTTAIDLGKNTHVQEFWWVSPGRILFNIAERQGELDEPRSTGELFAVDADGGKVELLVGYRAQESSFGRRLQSRKQEYVAAYLVDDLPGDERSVLVSIVPFEAATQSSVERMDVYTGKRVLVSRSPVLRASYLTDHEGVVRFAIGARSDNYSKLYYRVNRDSDWKLINDESLTGRVEIPFGFSGDNKTAYIQTEHAKGPHAIVAFDVATESRTEILRDKVVDPWLIVHASGAGSIPVGAVFMDGIPRTKFFDEASPDAKLQRSLEAAFPGQAVRVTSTTDDGKFALVSTSGAGHPGEFFLFDTGAMSATHIFSRRKGLDPATMGEVRRVELKARDGLTLHGYLTLPKGSAGKNLPTVVMPHGGPIGVFDKWVFNDDAQLLAKAGYAVLQVNFRGSGNYGRAFEQAGGRQWGGKMQDDVTDATRWAIDQGISDAGRICIYGASYGAYASLMGVAKEPELYKCAAGYVGVYDLNLYVSNKRGGGKSSATWLSDWVGEGEMLATSSPVNLAQKIKVPVLLVAGEEDEVAPIAHSKKMEAALRKASVPVETHYVAHEGHGFYAEAARRAYYVKLLDFLARHLGGLRAK